MNLKLFSATSLRIVAASAALAAGATAFASAANLTPADGPRTVAQSDSAPPPGGGGPGGGRHLMAQALMSAGLSDDQKNQIRGIMRDVRNQNKSTNADPETRRANYKAAFAKIDAIMTPDQRAKFKAKMQELRGERQQQGGNS